MWTVRPIPTTHNPACILLYVLLRRNRVVAGPLEGVYDDPTSVVRYPCRLCLRHRETLQLCMDAYTPMKTG